MSIRIANVYTDLCSYTSNLARLQPVEAKLLELENLKYIEKKEKVQNLPGTLCITNLVQFQQVEAKLVGLQNFWIFGNSSMINYKTYLP